MISVSDTITVDRPREAVYERELRTTLENLRTRLETEGAAV